MPMDWCCSEVPSDRSRTPTRRLAEVLQHHHCCSPSQHCVQDLLDGYFPSELQHQFPSGVPFKLNDQRNVTFVPRVPGEVFPGSGERLGGVSGISTSELPGFPPSPFLPSLTSSISAGPRLSADQFLARLPASVVRRGRVVEIRSELSSALRGSPQPSSLTLLQTPALDHLRSRSLSPPSPLSHTDRCIDETQAG